MWPFTSTYPEWSPDQVDGKAYDYVILGGKKEKQYELNLTRVIVELLSFSASKRDGHGIYG